ncbi:MAG: TetR/AcrR family transcriptional regulator [Henriciella sp.]|nr:TetR/AcrR family transcriptional regulator [Henriciella sp.]
MTQDTTRRSNKMRRKASIEGVLQAARELFVRQGYRATTVDGIAREAGLTKGAFYFYFSDKESLILELLRASDQQLFAPILQQMRATDGTARAKIELFLNLAGKAGADKNIELLLLPVLMSIEFNGRGGAVEQFLDDVYERVYQDLSDTIERGQSDGEFASAEPPRVLATMIVALSDGLLLELYRQSSQVSGREIAHGAKTSVLALLGSGADHQ